MSKKLLADPVVQKLIESAVAKAVKAERTRAVAAVKAASVECAGNVKNLVNKACATIRALPATA